MSLDPDFVEKLSGTLGNVLKNHLEAEQSPSNGNDMGLDVFINDFEDEFPRDPDDPALGSYPTYSEEANRAAKEEPYGLKRGDRPKVWELNQPPPSRIRGWRVVDLYPNREIKSEFYRLAGTPSEIRMMAQLIRHTQELVKKFGSGSINFEEWFKQWADGWETLTNRSNPALNLTTNYPALDSAKVDPATGTSTTIERWRTPTTKPGYIEWKDPLGKGVDGYRVVEYFPNKNDTATSVIFSGSDTDIISHIIRYHSSAQGVGEYDEESSNRLPGEISQLTNNLYIKLFFSEPRQTVKSGYRAVRAEFMFRIMDKTATTITVADLKDYTTKITENFYPGKNPYEFTKGKEYYTYHNWEEGYHFHAPFYSQTEAKGVLNRILAIQDHVFDESRFKVAKAINPALSYPEIPPSEMILGENVKLPARLPIKKVRFRWAEFCIPKTGQKFTLVSDEPRKPVHSKVVLQTSIEP